jgi:hypothetical protein
LALIADRIAAMMSMRPRTISVLAAYIEAKEANAKAAFDDGAE